MIEVYKHVHSYDDTLIPGVSKLQPNGIRKHDFQLVWSKAKDGVRDVQENSFYFLIIKVWHDLTS